MRKEIGAAALSCLLAIGVLSGVSGAQQSREHNLLLKVGDRSWKYDKDQLRALATKEVVSSRGSKKNPAIPLDVLLTKDTQLTMDRIIGVVIVGGKHVLLLEGHNLAHLKHLVLKFGPNHLTLVPETEETYNALKPIWGKPRLEDVERIDVFERR
ncbi:MAG: hypothetical protein HY724_10370 [Candidatus Rokubacteria bacterium]|nr:hypothetical protein [Candidatus Rokubacteria bacterium]